MLLTGRQTDQDRVAAALDASRVVVLVGPAGIGKSALAASFCVDRPVLWIDARASLAPAALPGATTGLRDVAELVVLDGIRADESPDRLADLLEGFAVPVLLTSQRELDDGLHHVAVGPLSATAGAALLRHRLAHPARSAMLPTTQLMRLSSALGGVPGELVKAARQLAVLDVSDLLEPRTRTNAEAPVALRRPLIEALAHMPGPVTVRLLSTLCGGDATPVVSELVAAGLAEVFPAGATTVRLRPLAGPVDDGGAAGEQRLTDALSGLLPAWEALAKQVEHGGWRRETARLAEDVPALELLCKGEDMDVALRAACLQAVVCQRLGPETRILEIDAALPAGGEPLLAARWGTFVAKTAIRRNDGPTGLAALDRRPAPTGSLEAVDQMSLRARLLEVTGEREDGARLRAEAVELAAGTPIEGDVLYRDAIGRYWTGDYDGALEGLDSALACSDPEVHPLRVVKLTILRTLLRRGIGQDSTELLAQMLPIDPLWRRTQCEEGPTVLVLTGALHADLEQWAEASRMLAEATELFLRLGRRDEAANQALQGASFLYVRGRVPELELDRALGLSSPEEVQRRLAPFSRAELLGWRAVRAAAVGDPARARVELDGATELFETVGRPHRGTELAAYVVGALIGADLGDDALVDELLPRIEGTPQLAHLHSLLAEAREGAAPAATTRRLEHHVLSALIARRDGLRVAQDGGWFQAPGEEPVSLARKYVLKRALGALAATPDGLTLPELVAQTWPDRQLVGDSGRRRGEVAISSLRALGLRDAVVTVSSAEGTRWRLDAVVVPS
ncbi:MAG: hypothetical protein GY913_10525 [Proteobacteria bacterium]|nr:hypothetical protein [Pseudomonadota bacterium]MCP4917348.1 hypothetical protein [Pseudomonadota bacterium]